jgi:hypothetical protein
MARESGLFKTLCPIFVKKTVEIIEEIKWIKKRNFA